MKSPQIYDQKDFKWNFLDDKLIFDSRKNRQLMVREGIKPNTIFFSKDVSFS